MKRTNRIAVIGGTGFDTLLARAERIEVETPWGDVEVGLSDGVVLLHRHGRDALPPHRISHRANVEALARCGVDAVLAINSVGALRAELPAGSLLVPDDLLDLRKKTETFHEARAVHVDVTEPYCPHLRALLLRHAAGAHDGGTYVATEGPRLETRAEIRMLQKLGGDVVGMTGAPEAFLARERGFCYAALGMVVNAAAGMGEGPIAATQLRADSRALAPRALEAALAAARDVAVDRACVCRGALASARL